MAKKCKHFWSKASFYDPTLLCVLNHKKGEAEHHGLHFRLFTTADFLVCPHLEFSQSLLIWHWKWFSLNTEMFPSLFSTSWLIFINSYITKKGFYWTSLQECWSAYLLAKPSRTTWVHTLTHIFIKRWDEIIKGWNCENCCMHFFLSLFPKYLYSLQSKSSFQPRGCQTWARFWLMLNTCCKWKKEKKKSGHEKQQLSNRKSKRNINTVNKRPFVWMKDTCNEWIKTPC